MQIARAGSDPVDMLSFSATPGARIRVRFSQNRLDIQRLFIGAQGINPDKTDFTVGPGFISAEGQPQQWREDGSARGTFLWRDPSVNRWYVATATGNTGDALVSGALLETEADLSSLDTSGMEPSAPRFPNVLLINTGNGNFQNKTTDSGTADASNSRSGLWVDLDNDSDLDLFQVNAGFNGAGKQPHVCFINVNGKFQSYPLSQGPYEQFGRGDSGLVADFNKDGRQDLFILNGAGLLPANRGPYQLFLNRTNNTNQWVSFRLVGTGKDYTNRDAIGARIEVRPIDQPGKSLWRFVTGTNGNYSQSSRVLHFGVGQSTELNVRVIWPPSKRRPNGHQQSFTLNSSDINRIRVVDELKGLQ
jgi:hypothetical protein